MKASPMIRTFNGGEFSPLMAGRVDLDRYPASLQKFYNMIAAPQGPAISRSGTAYVTTNRDNDELSVLVPFIFSNEQAKILEFTADRIRFLDEDGLQVYAGVTVDTFSLANFPIQFVSADLLANVGDQVVITGFPNDYNLNGRTANIIEKPGPSSYKLDVNIPAGKTPVDFVASRVYHVPFIMLETHRKALRFVQSVDVLYLLTGSQPYKLSRYGTYDWRLTAIQFRDGPYLPINEEPTTIQISATGNAIPNMTSNNAPAGVCSGDSNRPAISGTFAAPDLFLEREITYDLVASEYYYAFDDSDITYWASGQAQGGFIQYDPAAPFICNGYTIFMATENQDAEYLAKDFAPATWTFQGWNGVGWEVLDEQQNYVLYDNNKSVFFELDNSTSYSKYRLVVSKLTRNGSIELRVRRLVLRSTASVNLTLTASSVVGINKDQGFLQTDVGRVIRLKGSEGVWRALRITGFTSSTVVSAKLEGEPFLNTRVCRQWRLGYWSNTTGWPTVGGFFDDRLWLAGPAEYPDQFAGSVTGDYEAFSQTDVTGAVLDDSAVVLRLNSRRLSPIRWLAADERGLILGTGSEEYTVKASQDAPLTARTAKARPATRRGSASVEPVRVDNQILYVQRSGRTIREFAYVFEADGYKSPSMSQLASHLGSSPFLEMDYAAEPHSIVWMRRDDGKLMGLTYNREENVVGWHRHGIGGSYNGNGEAFIESLAVIPSQDQLQDVVWLVCKRTINGTTQRYIERMTRFWDFGMTLDNAHFVDSALRYDGDPIEIVYGLHHLEGQEVYGLVDNRPVGPLSVQNGAVELSEPASKVILGLGYISEAETSNLENGAADGTAQGKVKRSNSVVVAVWDSWGGEVGVPLAPDENGEVQAIYVSLEEHYPGNLTEHADTKLYTGMIGPLTPEPSYEMKGSIFFRRPMNSPLPFNVTALMPQLNTQDR